MNNKYKPPYFWILVLATITNIVFSTYFIAIMFTGVVFKIFTITLKKRYYYLFVLSLFTFFNIANIQGLNFISFIFTAFILNFIIIPKIKHLISSKVLQEFIYLMIFYISILVFNHIILDMHLFSTITINFIIDSLIIGFIL